jgi:multisubunit Na+/H+ antiporter MnhG subunit
MTPHMKWGIAGVALGIILLIALPGWIWEVGLAVILLAIAVPIGAYLMLDPSQRRRLREIRRRQIR